MTDRADFAAILFGKPFEALTCTDVQNALAALDESPAIEFKETFGNEKELKEGVLRSIVAFLNSKDGYGLLVLGVRDERGEKRIAGISTKLVKGRNPAEVESHLRNIVFNGLKSHPSATAPPLLHIKVFECSEFGLGKEGWLILIYVEKKADVLYYSEFDGSAYVREGSSTRRLSVAEAIQIAESKRKPIVVLLLEPLALELRSESSIMRFRLFLVNIGSKPSLMMTGALRVPQSIGPNFAITDVYITKRGIKITSLDVPIFKNEKGFKVNIRLNYPLAWPPLFPNLFLLLHAQDQELEMSLHGELPDEVDLNFYAEIYTEETKTEEKYVVKLRKSKETIVKDFIIEDIKVVDYTGAVILERKNWDAKDLLKQAYS